MNITIKDVNDNVPQFSSAHVTASISEGITSSTTIYSAHASDKDSRENGNGEVRYKLQHNPNNLFYIDATSGEIHLAPHAKLDYEVDNRHELIIIATDQASLLEQLSSSMTLTVNVQDANDNIPEFSEDIVVLSASEADEVNHKYGPVEASDKDSGENSRLSYSFTDSELSSKFGIFPSDGYIYLKEKLDREVMAQYTLHVKVRDHGQPSLSATATVIINVDDYNDNAPEFSRGEYHFYIEENQPAGQFVGKVKATDADSGYNALLQYDFVSSQDDFLITDDTGIISTSRSLDRELAAQYDIEVTVEDAGSPVQRTNVRVRVTVTDINDHDPVIQNSQFMGQVDENQSKGVRVLQVVARDPDAGTNGSITFSLEPG